MSSPVAVYASNGSLEGMLSDGEASGGDRKLKWSIATYARLKPRTEEDDELRFIPYIVHPRDEKPMVGKKRSGRAHRPLELGGEGLSVVQSQNHLGPSQLEGDDGDDDWEQDSGWVGRQGNKLLWGFDEIFGPDSSQDEVYTTAVHRLVLGVLDGYNGTLFAYGQTGSGKTYTVQGGDGYQQRGLIPRTVQAIFDEIAVRGQQQELRQRQTSPLSRSAGSNGGGGGAGGKGKNVQRRSPRRRGGKGNAKNADDGDDEPQYLVSVSFCQIYNEAVYDLLETGETRNGPIESWPKVELQEDGEGALHLKGLRTYRARDAEEALSMYFLGATNRITSATPMNVASSRSHAVFTINVDSGSKTTFADGEPTRGKIHLVDLAGSERVYKSGQEEDDDEEALARRPDYVTHDKKTRQEGRRINLSLHYLEQVIVSLQEASTSERRGLTTRHIPYRNSVLTSYLRDSLGGNCRTTFVVTLSLAAVNLDETVSTCRFAHRCAQLQVDIEKNRPMSPEYQMQKLREQNQRLTATLHARDMEVAGLRAQLRTSVQTTVRLRRRLRGHTRVKLEPDDVAVCRGLTDSYLRHDADAEAAVHGEADPEMGEVILDENMDAIDGVDLVRLPEPFPEPLEELSTIMGEHRAACEVLARRDEDLADASILREMTRLLRSHAEYAAEMAAAAREEVEVLRGGGNGGGNGIARATSNTSTKMVASAQKTPSRIDMTSRSGLRGKWTPSRPTSPLSIPPSSPTSPSSTLKGRGFFRDALSDDGEDSEGETPRPVSHVPPRATTILEAGRTDTLTALVTRLVSDPRVTNSETIRRISSSFDKVALSIPHSSLAAMLVAGGMFIKHGRRGRPRARWLWLSADASALLWRRRGDQKVRGELLLRQFHTVQLGKANVGSNMGSGLFKGGEGDDAFLSLIGDEKKLTLQVEVGNAKVTCRRARDTWARAFAHILGAIHIGVLESSSS